MKLGWYVQSRNLDVASVRFRCFHMAAALAGKDVASLVFDDPSTLIQAIPDLDAVIIVKRMDSSILDVAAAANDSRKAVLIDFCDDVLAAEYRPNARDLYRAVFRGVLPLVDAIVTTGPGMTARLKEYDLPLPPIIEVPDVAETKLVLADTVAFAETVLSPPQVVVEIVAPPPVLSEAERALVVVPERRTLFQKIRRSVRHPLWTLDRAHQVLSARTSSPGRAGPVFAVEKILHRTIGKANSLARYLASRASPPPSASNESESDAHPGSLVSMSDVAEQKKKIDRRPRVVWFGNHGAPHSTFGMLSLLQVADSLRRAYARKPFVIELVSNNREKFDAFLVQLGVPCIYIPWTLETVYDAIDRATVALVTSGDDSFCDVKSSNRALQALGCGRPVVGPPSPSLAPLGDFVLQGDVGEAILRYLDDEELRTSHVKAASETIASQYSFAAVAATYAQALAGAMTSARARPVVERVGRSAPRIMFLLDLAQDLAVLQPLLREAHSTGIETLVLATPRAGKKTPGLTEFLVQEKLIPTMVTEADLARGDVRWLRAADAVVMAAESSLPPHRIAHAVAGLANRYAIPAVSLQHGLEVLGLTARVETSSVRFNSDVIFTWADPAALPDWLDPDIRRRCVGLGRSWILPQNGDHGGNLPIGVFENLHWERYSNEYRRAFVDDLLRVADAIKGRQFVVHAHPAGLWFRKHGPQQLPNNVVVADQVGEGMRIIADSDCVITTPSTIALDAAQIGRPVAIAQYDLADTSTYDPLQMLRGADDWIRFIADASSPDAKKAQELFRRRVCRPGDATSNILKAILSNTHGGLSLSSPR